MGGITQTVNPVEDCGRDPRVLGKPGDEVGRRQVGSGGRTQQVAGRRSQAGEQHWQRAELCGEYPERWEVQGQTWMLKFLLGAIVSHTHTQCRRLLQGKDPIRRVLDPSECVRRKTGGRGV